MHGNTSASKASETNQPFVAAPWDKDQAEAPYFSNSILTNEPTTPLLANETNPINPAFVQNPNSLAINPGLSSFYGNLVSPTQSALKAGQGFDVSRYNLDKSFLDTFNTTKMGAEG